MLDEIAGSRRRSMFGRTAFVSLQKRKRRCNSGDPRSADSGIDPYEIHYQRRVTPVRRHCLPQRLDDRRSSMNSQQHLGVAF